MDREPKGVRLIVQQGAGHQQTFCIRRKPRIPDRSVNVGSPTKVHSALNITALAQRRLQATAGQDRPRSRRRPRFSIEKRKRLAEGQSAFRGVRPPGAGEAMAACRLSRSSSNARRWQGFRCRSCLLRDPLVRRTISSAIPCCGELRPSSPVRYF